MRSSHSQCSFHATSVGFLTYHQINLRLKFYSTILLYIWNFLHISLNLLEMVLFKIRNFEFVRKKMLQQE